MAFFDVDDSVRKLHGSKTVFDSDPYVEVGADGTDDRGTIMTQGVSATMYERQLTGGFFSPKHYRPALIKQHFTAVRLPESVGN